MLKTYGMLIKTGINKKPNKMKIIWSVRSISLLWLRPIKKNKTPTKKDKAKVAEEAFRDTHTTVVHGGIEFYVNAENKLVEMPSSFE